MLPESPVNNVLLGALLSGILLIINNQLTSWVNNKSQLEREEKQRIWQLEREEKQRIWQEESNRKKWYREEIYDSYKTSIQILTKIIYIKYEMFTNRYADTATANQRENNLFKLYFEFTSEFYMITANHPDKDTEEFKEKITRINEETMEKEPLMARVILIKIMEQDPRIKDINK
jgi:lipopolysaccharide export LptBFGC system permease protein LptF